MPTYIDEIATEVTTEPAQATADTSDERFAEAIRLRRYLERQRQLEDRVKAEGFSD